MRPTIYESEYDALKEIAANPFSKGVAHSVDQIVQRQLSEKGLITAKRKAEKTETGTHVWSGLRITKLGLDALAEHENIQRHEQEVKDEQNRLKKKQAFRDRLALTMGAIGVLGFFVSVLNAWGNIVALATKVFSRISSLFH